MNTFNHLKGNFVVSGVGIGVGILSKHLLKKEFIQVSSPKQILYSYLYLTAVTIAGKLTMDKLIELHWLTLHVKGTNKMEGFIGPLDADAFFGPPHLG